MLVLACDFGGTTIKLGILRDGTMLADRSIPAQSDRGLRSRLAEMEDAFSLMCENASVKFDECAGLSVSFPSLMDQRSGRILDHYGKYADAPEVDLHAWAKKAMGLPLAIENDARMALIGEWQHGAGRGCNNVVMITLGTGLGTAAVIEGRVLRGGHGQAGCLGGHMTVRYGGHPCHCGNVGCAEAEASTLFITRLAKERSDFRDSPLSREALVDYAAIVQHSRAGDGCAIALLEHSIRVWGALAVSLIHAYDPEILVLGGGVMGGGDMILPAIQQYVGQYAHTPWGKVNVVASQLGDRAALLAAEWLVHEQIECHAGKKH